MTTWNRRSFLKTLSLGAAASALPLGGVLFPRRASAFTASNAKRVIFFYWPDGVPPASWYISSLSSLSTCLAPLAPYTSQILIPNNLYMGPADEGSHPGGAEKLLTCVNQGQGVSIDRVLANSVGKDVPFPHVYLGSMSNGQQNGGQINVSADHWISYPVAGASVSPNDNPSTAFSTLFGSAPPSTGGTTTPPGKSILDAAIGDMTDLEASLGTVEKSKLDLHLQALRDLESRITAAPPANTGNCSSTPPANVAAAVNGGLGTDANYQNILRAQMDVMVNAMACGLTRVGVIQGSVHTSELIMSRIPSSPMFQSGIDMRSHQASHNGPGSPELTAHINQNVWWVQQLAYLLNALKSRPEGDGTMLDYSMVFMCTEVADSNAHTHSNMPFILAGSGGGRIKTGKVIDGGGRRHADLYIAMANAMGNNMTSFGDTSAGPLPGVL